ncbi:hypothetical protein P879_07981 [Paragonimus westermani]|uniref:Uncharacterized protein n=1 Tax=Paragonimus westermani TaxID=34504 RepID=A0A8T0DCC2_9TREM|nr:hypothetical protein P879_07981 [Paragonimus westermani]
MDIYFIFHQLDTRVSCIRALNNEILLVGMMSDKLCAYSIETKEMLWQLPLHDIITDIVVAEWPHEHMNRVFAGLGNGELLVIENASVNEPKDSMFIFTIGFTRVSSLLLMDNQLWCACSHSVYVFNTATLDYQLHFNISDNALDLISTMKSSAYGVWIAVRGSPVIELWNPKTYSRLLLFNTCTEAYLDYREEDEGTFHVQRVTALLPYENTIWIGTGNGDVIVFEIIDESLQGKATSPFQSESDLANPSVAMNEVRAHSSNGSANVSTADSYQDVQSLAAEQTYCSLPNRHTKKHDQHVTFRTNKVGSGIDEPNTEGPATSMYNVGKLDLNAEAKRINFRKVDSEPTVTWADNRAESAPCLLQTSSNADGYSINVDLAEPRTEPIMSAQSPLDSTPHTYSPDILLQNVMQHLDDCISDSPEQSTSPVYQESDSKSPGQETNEMNGQTESNDFADKDEASLSHSNQSLSNLDQNGSRDLTKISLTASMKSESVASSPSNYFHDCQSTGSDDCSPVLPVPNPMFCPLRRHSRLIEPKADRKLPRLQLQPMLRNKVSETPIRLFVTQRNKDGERVIISCATYFNDDDAVLKWHRCKTETMMWSNQPILYYDAVSQQVHFPAYMLNTMRMRRDSSRRITIAT